MAFSHSGFFAACAGCMPQRIASLAIACFTPRLEFIARLNPSRHRPGKMYFSKMKFRKGSRSNCMRQSYAVISPHPAGLFAAPTTSRYAFDTLICQQLPQAGNLGYAHLPRPAPDASAIACLRGPIPALAHAFRGMAWLALCRRPRYENRRS